jgi:Dyp-type peroxidase family
MVSNVPAREAPFPSSLETAVPVQKHDKEPLLDTDQIQGNILPGFLKDNQTLIFLEIEDTKSFRPWLKALVPFIATSNEVLQFNRLFKMIRSRRGVESRAVLATWLNIAFSFRGIQKLKPRNFNAFKDKAFREGLAARSKKLNDPLGATDEGFQANWLIGGKDNEADLLLIVASDSLEEMGIAVRRIESWIYEGAEINGKREPSGAEVLYKQKGATLPAPLTGHEHFGFLDGVSQPGVRGIAKHVGGLITPEQNPADHTQGKPGQDRLWPGEFVFGYPGQDPTDADAEGQKRIEGPEWTKNGSYLVFRRLRQDVGGFHSFLKTEGNRLNLGPELFGAKCVGRWASGAPIERSTKADNLRMSRDDCANNAFNFQEATVPAAPNPGSGDCKDDFPTELAKADPLGIVCPFASHIRKAYPRDDTPLTGPKKGKGPPNEGDTETHRLLRRGIPFGDPFDPSIIPDDGNRGLLFLAYQTSIERQFEFVTTNWVNDPDFKDPGSGHDPILGQTNKNGSRERFFPLTLPNGTEVTVRLEKDWVIPTGGGYFFAPSLKALSNELSDSPNKPNRARKSAKKTKPKRGR